MKHIKEKNHTMTGTCVAFGCFDGVHTGHRAVAEKLVEAAAAKNLVPVLVSFSLDSSQNRILTTEREKEILLQTFGIDTMISLPAPDDIPAFIRDVLVKQLDAQALVTGQNYTKLALLHNCAGELGLDVVKCETVSDNGLPVSTQRIMDALQDCQLDDAARLLGQPYTVAGTVVTGKQLGRTVGQPTANIDFARNKQLPPDGSYVTMTWVDGVKRVGTTNIGKRPTVDNFDYATMENHILDFSGDLYGRELVLEFHRFMRGVEKFNSLAEVQAQVAKDIQSLRNYIDSLQ